MIAVEQREEARLGSGRALDTSEPDIIARTLQVAEVPEEFLEPQSCALSDGRQLRGLEVCEAEGGQVAVLLRKLGKAINDYGELLDEEVKSLANEDEICVASAG